MIGQSILHAPWPLCLCVHIMLLFILQRINKILPPNMSLLCKTICALCRWGVGVVGPTPKSLAIISWGPRQNILEKHGRITECNWSIRYSPADSLSDWSPRIPVRCDWLVCRVGLWWRCITAASLQLTRHPRPSTVVTLHTTYSGTVTTLPVYLARPQSGEYQQPR